MVILEIMNPDLVLSARPFNTLFSKLQLMLKPWKASISPKCAANDKERLTLNAPKFYMSRLFVQVVCVLPFKRQIRRELKGQLLCY